MRSFSWLSLVAVVSWLAQLPASGQVSVKLNVDVRRIVNETVAGDATLLFDEQKSVGDPRAGTGKDPTNEWTTSWSDWYYPVSAIIDLAGKCHLTDVSFFDGQGVGDLEVQALVSNTWVQLFTDPQDTYLNWITYHVSADTRYVRVVCHEVNTIPAEMVLYGWRLEPEQSYPSPVAPPPQPFDQFMGVNSLIIDPLGRQEAFGCVREYHDWDWDEGGSAPYPNDQNQWFNSYTGGWNFDLFYRNLKLTGLLTVPCKQSSVNWLGLADSDYKPILAGSGRDPQVPASYVEHADHLYQFAARYGTTPVADAKLKLSDSEPRLSGLGYVHYIEDWNEPDKWWKDRDGFFLPAEYAAMSSADVDGHLGSLGNTVGIKTADPQSKFVMAGLASINVEYIKSMKYWCDRHRNGNVPWDVINVHHYSNDAGDQLDVQATTGISPEADGLQAKAAKLVDYRNRFLPGKEVWVSEFGYDVHPQSIQRAPAIGSTPAEEVQGRWVVRSFLALAAAGVDRAYLFMLSDPSTTDSTQYSTSGMLQDQWHGFAVRPGWFYCKTLKERLRGLHYRASQASGNAKVMIHQFADTNGVVKAYAVWCPTANNTTVTGYALTLQGSPTAATLVTLANGAPVGTTTALRITRGQVTLNVSEKPVLVLTGTLPAMDLPDKLFPLTKLMVHNEANLGNATLLADEQSLVGDPANGLGGSPSTLWFPSWNSADYPASAYLDLGKVLPVTKLLLYDLQSDGLVTVSTGSPGHWQPVFQDDMRNYGNWNLHVLNVNTRYLRFTRDMGGNFGEVAIYTNAWLNR